MTDADTSQRISAEPVHAQRLAALETCTREHDDALTTLDRHRERSETRWSLVSGVVGALGVLALGVAGLTRDSARDTAARTVALEARLTAIESDRGRRDVDDRASSAAIVRLQTTVDAMQHSLDARLGAIESRLSQDDRAPRAR